MGGFLFFLCLDICASYPNFVSMSTKKKAQVEKREKTFNMKVMYAINVIAIVVFVLGVTYKIIQYMFFK